MGSEKEYVTQIDLSSIIEDFIAKSSGLAFSKSTNGDLMVVQKNDSKKVVMKRGELIEVLARRDADGKEFVQVNFSTGRKLLLTDQLVGFKPHSVSDLDVSKLPKVVTTLDLLSVFEAIEEATTSEENRPEEAEVLKKVFNAILLGGEEAGFDLTTERSWLRRLPTVTSKSVA